MYYLVDCYYTKYIYIHILIQGFILKINLWFGVWLCLYLWVVASYWGLNTYIIVVG